MKLNNIMENKIVFIILAFLITTSVFSQRETDRYIRLSQHESKEFLEKPFISGNGYLIYQDKGKVRGLAIKKWKNGKKDGEWLTFLKTAGSIDLVNVSNYKNGLKNGYYYNTDNHVFSEEGYYKNDKKHGLWIKKTFSDIETIEKTNYKKGKKHGDYILTQIIDGKSIVLINQCYRNGKLKKQTNSQ